MILLLFWNIAFLLHVKSFETFAKSVLCQLGQGRIWVNMRNETQIKPTWNSGCSHFLSLSQMKRIDWRANRDGEEWFSVKVSAGVSVSDWHITNIHHTYRNYSYNFFQHFLPPFDNICPQNNMEGQRINIQISPVLRLCTTIADGRVYCNVSGPIGHNI